MRLLFRGAFIGAGLMYLLDPRVGRRRRAVVKDKANHFRRAGSTVISKASRDFHHRLYGRFAESRSRMRDDDVPDHIIIERIRSKIGRAVSHPRAIQIQSIGGRVRLSGAVLAPELGDLLATVTHVRGVRTIDNQLSAYSHPGDGPSLQPTIGSRHRPSSRLPAVRFIADLIPMLLFSVLTLGLFKRQYGVSLISGALLGRYTLGSEDLARTRRSRKARAAPPAQKNFESARNLTDPLTYVRMYSHH